MDTNLPAFSGDDGPGPLLIKARQVKAHDEYAALADAFAKISQSNYDAIKKGDGGFVQQIVSRFSGGQPGESESVPFQQFFFKVADDTGLEVTDYFVDFHVLDAKDQVEPTLTKQFDDFFKADFHTHSVNASCRVMMVDCAQMEDYAVLLKNADTPIGVHISGCSSAPNVTFLPGHCVIFDPVNPKPDEPSFLFPNTTTLVEIILVRQESDSLLSLLYADLKAASYPATVALIAPLTGRARLLVPKVQP